MRTVDRWLRRSLVATVVLAASAFLPQRPSQAMPIFAQRYQLRCAACHTVLPELNAFGNAFRDHGFRLPPAAPVHGNTGVALRYNNEYEADPVPGMRRFTPTASLLSEQNIGAIGAYLHYNVGAGGAPGAPYLGYLVTYNEHTHSLYRLGLYELPLTQSPGQRLDDIAEYGYLGTTVGQNDLALNAPRLGFEAQRDVGQTRIATSIAFGEFKGAAYGGAPVFDNVSTRAARPEIELFAHGPLLRNVDFNAEIIDGERAIRLPSRSPFDDPYARLGFGFETSFLKKRLDLEAQQWLGRDNDADGAGNAVDSSGGYARLKYFVTPHFYTAARYDTAANPFPTRGFVFYAGALVTGHARLEIEERLNALHGSSQFGGEFIVGFPWPLGY
ncbi:MAG: hypothetical protein ABSB70_25395 [Candidatus Velthaea sp.]|jgi:mono/diheme cytochrome c family protein